MERYGGGHDPSVEWDIPGVLTGARRWSWWMQMPRVAGGRKGCLCLAVGFQSIKNIIRSAWDDIQVQKVNLVDPLEGVPHHRETIGSK